MALRGTTEMKDKGTRKVAPMHAMKAWRSRGIAPIILNLSN